MSLLMFNDQCENILKLIGNRVVSLRLTLIDIIDGWSLVSSYLQYHQISLLQHLHLIGIEPHEFDKLLRNHNVNQIENGSLEYQITLPNLLNTNHLRTLTIGIHTSHFLERLLLCIPFIENFSFSIKDRDSDEHDTHDTILLPTSIDTHHLRYLSRLRINCMNSISFHRIIALLSSVFGQLCHLSLKLEAFTSISDPLIISGDNYSTIVSCQMPINPLNLFPRADTLSLRGYKRNISVREFSNCRSSISSLVPWSSITNISINHSNVLTRATLESILRMAYNVHTLDLFDDGGILLRPILNNYNLTTLINQQIKSFEIFDISLTLQNAQRICTLLSNRLFNLKKLSFSICDGYDQWRWKPSCIVNRKNKSTKRIVTLIYLLVDQLQKLVSLRIIFSNSRYSDTPCFPHLIRRQLHHYPFNQPFRLRVTSNEIHIWL
ncbi:unnamed protein product [Rotaria sordida]|uniref:Uncharacterized protein n=1 Tax=Rotaria sordida TaxID=392033 RepID=A0A815XI39_9BILA|nr:unnamed protein product [Rotaria sordida]